MSEHNRPYNQDPAFVSALPADRLREHILALVAKYGPDVLDMSRTLESELHILCPDQPSQVDSLVAALRHGIVHYLLVLAENGKWQTVDLPAQVRRLSAESGLNESEAEQAVQIWADLIGTINFSNREAQPGSRTRIGLSRTSTTLSALGNLFLIGLAGSMGSMLPWIAVIEERHEHFLVPGGISAIGTHTVLNLLGAAGGFLGGALGWILGTPLSLQFALSPRLDSAHRVIVAALTAALGSFFGLWLGYHHVADVGAFLGSFLCAGIGTFLATVFTWDK
jgi:hypothetical protein